ncbi:hypothetical protein SRABI96_03616 [Peribacillus sp. Bi96]|nr:hypothetical protein SRABI96_03616 [Peribacillus sp. Bi96]
MNFKDVFILEQAQLVIHSQQELMDGGLDEQGVFEKEKILYNINSVIGKAIQEKAYIVFVRDTDVSNGSGSGFQIHQEIRVSSTAVINCNC